MTYRGLARLLMNVLWGSFFPFIALGQLDPGLQSLDTPTDPRSISMGESFVAVHSPSSMMYNPAGLAGTRGVSFSFARRNLNHFDSDPSFKYITFSGTIETPCASFGFLYSRFIQGEFNVTTPASPDGMGTVDVADYILGLTAARNLVAGLDVGLTVKTFRFDESVVSGAPPIVSSNTPLLFDIGMIYSYSGVLVNSAGDFTFSGGGSLQNFGTDFKPGASPSNGATADQFILKLPRYLRCGIAFSMNVSPFSTGGLVPFAVLVAGEYRNFLNGRVDGERVFWGAGGEVTLFEIVSGRIGEYIQPFTSIYGERGNPYTRIGLGIAVPLARFINESPFVFTFDYSMIPLNTRIPYFYVDNSTLNAFSLGVRYDNSIVQ